MFILDSAFSGVVSAFIQDELLIQYLNRMGILSERADHDLSEVLLPVIGFIQIKYNFCSQFVISFQRKDAQILCNILSDRF